MKNMRWLLFADVFVIMQSGETPLYIAAYDGHLQICRELIEGGATIDLPQEVRTTVISRILIFKEV